MALRHGSPEDKERVAALLRQESSPSLALDVAGYSTNESLVDEIVRLHYSALSTEEYDHMVTGNLRKAVLRVTLSFTAEELQRLPLETIESGPCSFAKLIDNEEELKTVRRKHHGCELRSPVYPGHIKYLWQKTAATDLEKNVVYVYTA
ncbi:unnamed protein product [Ixodes persulcatus]